MKRIRRFVVAFAVVIAVNAAPVAHAGPVYDVCQVVQTTAEGYGWHGNFCIIDPRL